jgi:hypothetical protein
MDFEGRGRTTRACGCTHTNIRARIQTYTYTAPAHTRVSSLSSRPAMRQGCGARAASSSARLDTDLEPATGTQPLTGL